jgi:ferric-dicitrate binding protein FerR (iron transport regulator)
MDGTVITVAKGFGKESRDVDIDGRGMFFVRTPGDTGSRPFVVHTGNLIIEVLDSTGAGGGDGRDARFAVDAVRKQAGEETDLLDGKLRVSKSYHSDTDSLPEDLTAGDMVMINREIDLMEKEKMNGQEEDKVKEKFHISDR